jgi:hypothetical protein
MGNASVTIVDSNYLAFALVWARSMREHDPECDVFVVWLDGQDEDPGRVLEGFADSVREVLVPSDLPMSRQRFELMRLIYSVKELATAVKPWALSTLIARGYDVVTYMDPDILVTAPLAPLLTSERVGSALLTPHVITPLPVDDDILQYAHLRQAGIYNLGFIACSAASTELLAWWADRCMLDALDAPAAWLFTDQMWADFMPSLFGARAWRHPGADVAYWNVHEREIRLSADGSYTVNGADPLLFFHFSGFQGAKGRRLTTHWGVPGRWDAHLEEFPQPDLAALALRYRGLTADAFMTFPGGRPSTLDYIADATTTPLAVKRGIRDRLKHSYGRELAVSVDGMARERHAGPMIQPDGRPLELRIAIDVASPGRLGLAAINGGARASRLLGLPRQRIKAVGRRVRGWRRARRYRGNSLTWLSPDFGYWRNVEVTVRRVPVPEESPAATPSDGS